MTAVAEMAVRFERDLGTSSSEEDDSLSDDADVSASDEALDSADDADVDDDDDDDDSAPSVRARCNWCRSLANCSPDAVLALTGAFRFSCDMCAVITMRGIHCAVSQSRAKCVRWWT